MEMRRQGKTGSILSDGRKNVKKWPMVNFIFKSTMGTFLVSCVNSEKWKDEVIYNENSLTVLVHIWLAVHMHSGKEELIGVD